MENIALKVKKYLDTRYLMNDSRKGIKEYAMLKIYDKNKPSYLS